MLWPLSSLTAERRAAERLLVRVHLALVFFVRRPRPGLGLVERRVLAVVNLGFGKAIHYLKPALAVTFESLIAAFPVFQFSGFVNICPCKNRVSEFLTLSLNRVNRADLGHRPLEGLADSMIRTVLDDDRILVDLLPI